MANVSGTEKPVQIDEQAVRAKAHQLWIERGCPEGSAEQDWYAAQRLLRASQQAAAATQVESARQAQPRNAPSRAKVSATTDSFQTQRAVPSSDASKKQARSSSPPAQPEPSAKRSSKPPSSAPKGRARKR
jgi:hypothetical protein